jgi:hypothetical protein
VGPHPGITTENVTGSFPIFTNSATQSTLSRGDALTTRAKKLEYIVGRVQIEYVVTCGFYDNSRTKQNGSRIARHLRDGESVPISIYSCALKEISLVPTFMTISTLPDPIHLPNSLTTL